MIDKLPPTECTLCRACANACPTNAIRFTNEYDNFKYPVINTDVCIGCNRCEQVCPVLNPPPITEHTPKAYMAMSLDNENRQLSTSGGIFYEIAQKIIRDGGYVCGAVTDSTLSVYHTVTDDMEVLKQMRGSKYVQSDIRFVYTEIKSLLKKGKTVLFSGCPCQSAALLSFLGKAYDNLIIVDLICHGIASDASLRTYVSIMEKKYRSRIASIQFRSKDNGWHAVSIRIAFENRKVYRETIFGDMYFKGFLWNVYLKSSCHACKFRQYRSGSDITLGDCWGTETEPAYRGIDDNKGLSAVIIHTSKGQNLFSSLPVESREIPLSFIEKHNPNLLISPNPSPVRKRYFETVRTEGEEIAMIKYLKEPPRERFNRKSRLALRKLRNKLLKRKTLY